MLDDPVFNETHLQSPDFVEDDIDTEIKKWEYKVYQTYISLPDNFLYSSCQEKENSSPYDDCHDIYDKCKSKELITTFNHIVICVSYRQVQKAKSDLAQYTLM